MSWRDREETRIRNQWINLHALWQILVAGLFCGAGLPTVFALDLRAFSMPASGQAGIELAGVCFAIVAAGIVWSIYFIVANG